MEGELQWAGRRLGAGDIRGRLDHACGRWDQACKVGTTEVYGALYRQRTGNRPSGTSLLARIGWVAPVAPTGPASGGVGQWGTHVCGPSRPPQRPAEPSPNRVYALGKTFGLYRSPGPFHSVFAPYSRQIVRLYRIPYGKIQPYHRTGRDCKGCGRCRGAAVVQPVGRRAGPDPPRLAHPPPTEKPRLPKTPSRPPRPAPNGPDHPSPDGFLPTPALPQARRQEDRARALGRHPAYLP